MAELLKYKREVAAITLGLTTALGLTACGGSGENDNKQAEASSEKDKSPIRREVKYTPNGMRLVLFKGQIFDSPYANPRYENADSPSDTLEYCEGGDLMTQTLGYYNSSSTSIDRSSSPSSLAKCADGVLTPEDYEAKSVAPPVSE